MKVMIDTNVLISAALNPSGFVAKSLYKALVAPFEPVVCDYIVDEVHRKFQEKFPNDIIHLEAFLYNALQTIEVIRTPEESIREKASVRDVKDRPIIRADNGARHHCHALRLPQQKMAFAASPLAPNHWCQSPLACSMAVVPGTAVILPHSSGAKHRYSSSSP